MTYEGGSEAPFTGVAISKYDSGQKKYEATYKDGKPEGLDTSWFEDGQKKREATYKDGKQVSLRLWDELGNEIKE